MIFSAITVCVTSFFYGQYDSQAAQHEPKRETSLNIQQVKTIIKSIVCALFSKFFFVHLIKLVNLVIMISHFLLPLDVLF